MASSLTLALRTAQSGITASQQGLDAVAQNVANVNTVGYSKKVVNFEQRIVEGNGAGVQVSDITRQIDQNLLRSFRNENSEFTNFDMMDGYYSRLQELFGTPDNNSSISHIVGTFVGSLEQLAVSPDKGLEQTEVLRQATDLSVTLQQMTESIQDLRQQADQQIADIVAEVNRLTTTIGQLNDDIIKNESTGLNAIDLRDQRDESIDQLSGYVDIVTFQRSDGDIVVFTGAGRTLVDNVPATLSHSSAAAVSPTTTHAEGDFAGIFIGAQIEGNDITNEFLNGELAALVTMRDSTLSNLQSQLDEYASAIKETMNQLHNQGTPFPGQQTLEGTRRFVDPATQTIQLSAGDTRINLFNAAGEQQATTTLSTIMLDNTLGTGSQSATGPWTLEEVGQTMEDWIQANGAGTASITFDGNGQMNIDLNSTTLYLGFRDEVDPGTEFSGVNFNDNGANPDSISSTAGTFDGYRVGEQVTVSNTTNNNNALTITNISADGSTIYFATGSLTAEAGADATFVRVPPPEGSTHSNATILFNADGDLTTGSAGATGYDESVSGFSSFFGLNDFFVDGIGNNLYESDVVNNNLTSTAATLTFETANGAMTGSPLTVTAGLSLSELANLITANITDITASVVPDGAGSRLRIAHNDGSDFVVTQAAANTLLTDYGVSKAKVRTAGTLDIRPDIKNAPELISRGSMQWDANRGNFGEYFVSNADDDTITNIVEAFAASHAFEAAGGIGNLTTSFTGYGAEILARNSNAAEANQQNANNQKTLSEAIKLKSDNIRGVNLDEEMGNLIVFQQAFSAAARVISTIQQMFDALERAV